MEEISDFTEVEFIAFIKKIRVVNKGGTDDVLGELLEQFSKLVGHPEGYDLIFHPEPGADNSAEGVTETVKEWRAATAYRGSKRTDSTLGTRVLQTTSSGTAEGHGMTRRGLMAHEGRKASR